MSRCRRPLRDPTTWAVLLGLALAVIAHWVHALKVPFINDDYVFLDRVRDASFGSLWGTQRLMFGWWRPISRELHYWSLERGFGARELPFHVASFVLATLVLIAYFALIRRVAGVRVATLATVGVAALAAWAVPMVWIAGAQELWMLLFALLSIHAFAFGSVWVSALAFAAALLSKETAAVVPAIALAAAILVRGQSLRAALARLVPLAVIVGVWLLLHPAFRPHAAVEAGSGISAGSAAVSASTVAPSGASLHPPLGKLLLRTLLVPVNLDQLPAPEHGWKPVLERAAWSLLPLALLALWASGVAFRRRRGAGGDSDPVLAGDHSDARDSAHASLAPASGGRRSSRARLVAFGATWTVIGWLPVLWPALGWHAYYTLLGALGVWLLLALALVEWGALAPAVIALLVVLRAAQAATPSLDWGSEWYQNRAAAFLKYMRADLVRLHPTLAPNSRLFFSGVPSYVGFLTEGAPTLRVWYDDASLSGGYLGQYAVRPAYEPQGPDLFFHYDSTAGWVELTPGRQDSSARNPRWQASHRELAATFARAKAWREAGNEFALLADSAAEPLEVATNAGVCFAMAGDSSAAARWFELASRAPGADDQVKRFAQQFQPYLKQPRQVIDSHDRYRRRP